MSICEFILKSTLVNRVTHSTTSTHQLSRHCVSFSLLTRGYSSEEKRLRPDITATAISIVALAIQIDEHATHSNTVEVNLYPAQARLCAIEGGIVLSLSVTAGFQSRYGRWVLDE